MGLSRTHFSIGKDGNPTDFLPPSAVCPFPPVQFSKAFTMQNPLFLCLLLSTFSNKFGQCAPTPLIQGSKAPLAVTMAVNAKATPPPTAAAAANTRPQETSTTGPTNATNDAPGGVVVVPSQPMQTTDRGNGTAGAAEKSASWEESQSEEFLEVVKGDTLVKGVKVQEVKSQWNTNVGDDSAEATE